MFSSSTYTFLYTQKYYVLDYILTMKNNSSQKYNGNNIKKCIENNLDENKSKNNTNNDTFCFFSID